jgi:uncharacterized damage-inducible protein DinB
VNTNLKNIYEELENQRVEVLNQVKLLSTEQLNRVPSPGKWSISQILTHILIAEQLSVRYMKKKALGIDELENSGIIASIRIGLLRFSQRIPAIKYKAPQVVVANTPQAYPMNELSTRWEAHRKELLEFLNSIADKNVRKLVYKHPFAGRLNTKQALVFFREHINHHWPQIKRLLHQD